MGYIYGKSAASSRRLLNLSGLSLELTWSHCTLPQSLGQVKAMRGEKEAVDLWRVWG